MTIDFLLIDLINLKQTIAHIEQVILHQYRSIAENTYTIDNASKTGSYIHSLLNEQRAIIAKIEAMKKEIEDGEKQT